MGGIRFTKEVVEKFIAANEGYRSEPRSFSIKRYKGSTRYYIENGEVHQVEDANTMDEPSDRILDLAGARAFFKSELERFGEHLKRPEDI